MLLSKDRHANCRKPKEEQVKDKIQGKFEEAKGKLTDDKSEELKGKGRGVVGDVKQAGKEVAYDAEHPDRPEER
jgi:uncharacterized protein YjbJ (UPF0337 family)